MERDGLTYETLAICRLARLDTRRVRGCRRGEACRPVQAFFAPWPVKNPAPQRKVNGQWR
jgi:hypothetical protein